MVSQRRKTRRTDRAVPLDTVMRIRERRRTYLFPGGNTVVIKNPVELVVRPSGSHRVKTADGKVYIVARGWLCVEIVSRSGWAF